MENFYIDAVVRDLRTRFVGAAIGKIWQPNDLTLVIDVRQSDPRLLLVSVDPSDPSIYLTERGPRDFEPSGSVQFSFAAALRK